MHTPEAIEAVVASIQPLRKSWDANGIRAQIQKNPGRDLRELWIELGIAALTPKARTPAAIEAPGPWRDYTRKATKTGNTAAEVVHPMCPEHPEQKAGTCKVCYPLGCNRHPGFEVDCDDCEQAADERAEKRRATAAAGRARVLAARQAAKQGIQGPI